MKKENLLQVLRRQLKQLLKLFISKKQFQKAVFYDLDNIECSLSMIEQIITNLEEIKALLRQLTKEQYNKKLTILSGAFIGQHVRHILEFYHCLFYADENNCVDYDERKRDLQLETDKEFAANIINDIIIKLNKSTDDFPISFAANYATSEAEDTLLIKSSYYRELAYNMDHSIHHQALIKVAMKDMELDHLISNEFGFAPSTIRYLKSTCAQ